MTVRSQRGDPETCVIDCEGNEGDPHRGFVFRSDEGPGSAMEGITITRGWAEYYGGATPVEELSWGSVKAMFR